MKKIIVLVILISVSFALAQAFKGSGDTKFQVGVNTQTNATGINASYDFGVGENMSFGLSSSYLLSVDNVLDAQFIDRFDVKGRFNANLGNVINIDENFNIYPGLNLSLKNFSGHFGDALFFYRRFWSIYRIQQAFC